MVSSKKLNYIFVPVPKTGTVSIQKFLLKQDKNCVQNRVDVGGELVKVSGYITARQLKKLLGNQYHNYKTFSLIRNPYAKFVSHYFFLRDMKDGDEGTPGLNFKSRLVISLAKYLPFWIWSLIYPYRSNMEHVCDASGNVLVTHVGIFEHYNREVEYIMSKISPDFDVKEITHTHKTKHDHYSKYYLNKLHRLIVSFKVKRDLEFYNKMLSVSNDLAGVEAQN